MDFMRDRCFTCGCILEPEEVQSFSGDMCKECWHMCFGTKERLGADEELDDVDGEGKP
jgi:hypothetical protein